MNKTPIEWAKNPDGTQGYTWNPITGCLNHDNGLCKGGGFPCYAYKLANGRLRTRYLANRNLAPSQSGMNMYLSNELDDPFYPRFWPERCLELDYTIKLKYIEMGDSTYEEKLDTRRIRPKGIFVCDMSDLFGIGIPKGWQESIMNLVRMNYAHRFYLLTKQPQNLPQWSPFPDNCWVGVTATNPQMFYEAQEYLEKVVATIRYISLEPYLERIWTPQINAGIVDWLIIGACTGTYNEIDAMNYNLDRFPYGKKWTLQPKIEWVEEIVRAADKAGIPVFLKENLMPLFNFPVPGLFRKKFPAGRLELRQEMPG